MQPVRVNLIQDKCGNRAIAQGSTFDWMRILLDSDYSQWTVSGQIRSNYADDGGVIRATFSFLPLVYGTHEINNLNEIGTLICPVLSAAQTRTLQSFERFPGRPGDWTR